MAQSRETLYWTRYLAEINLGRHWEIDVETESRRLFSPPRQKQFFLRAVALYKINEKVKAGAGLGYFRMFEDEIGHFSFPELRPYQQLDVNHTIAGLDLEHSLRTEQRFEKDTLQRRRLETYSYSFRTRYRFQVDYSLAKKEKEQGHFAWQIQNEVFINVNNEPFDQNRFYVGFVVQPFRNIALEPGYMRVFQHSKEKWDVIRLTIRHYPN